MSDSSYQSKIECPINLDIECLGDCENCNYHKFFKDQDNDTSCQSIIDKMNEIHPWQSKKDGINDDWVITIKDFEDWKKEILSSHKQRMEIKIMSKWRELWESICDDGLEDHAFQEWCVSDEWLNNIKKRGDKLQEENIRLTKKVLFMEEAYVQQRQKVETIRKLVDDYKNICQNVDAYAYIDLPRLLEALGVE